MGGIDLKMLMQRKQGNCVCKECEHILEASEAARVACLCIQIWVLLGSILLRSFGHAGVF